MGNRHTAVSITIVSVALATITMPGCSKSRAELLQDRSALIERKLQSERDRALTNPVASERDSQMAHLQTLRLGLSMVNVSIVTVPVILSTEDERAIGYSVLDEALGTIDWNIPIYGSASLSTQRPYPVLFSPQTGLDFASIRRGNTPPGIAR